MFRRPRYLVAAFIFVLVSSAFAQGTLLSTGDLTYTFDSGVSFGVPANWILDTSSALPKVSVDDSRIVVEMVEPEFIGVTAEDTAGAPLLDVLDYLLGLVNYEGERADADTETFSLLDGREIVAFSFVNNSNNGQTVLVLRFSNTHVGAMNVRHTGDLSSLDQQTILAIANSFDLKPLDPEEAERQLYEGFSEPFVYPSGVSFRYPQEFVIEDDGELANIGIANVIFITMVDPAVVGLPAGEAIEDVIDFATEGSNIAPESFEPLDIGGREAVFASGPDGQLTQTLVLVRFSDDTVGIIDVVTLADPTDAQMLQIRGIAASFDSASSEFTGVTREDAERAEALFEQAMDLRGSGDLEGAIGLFDEALALDNTLDVAFFFRGNTYRELGQLEASLADLNEAKRLRPEQPEIRNSLAETYVLLDDFESALAELRDSVELQGANASQALLNEVALYERAVAGEFVEMLVVNRAERYRTIGLFDAAVADIDAAIENNPEKADLYLRRGVILHSAERYREAVATFTDALELAPTAIGFFNRGYAYQAGRDVFTDWILHADSDLHCAVLLADSSITEEQIAQAERTITLTIITGFDYEPPTEPEQCVP